MTLTEIFSILIIHWIADFWLQTDWQAKNKSKEWKPLLQHTFNYTLCWFIIFALWCSYQNHIGGVTADSLGIDWKILLFFPITFIAHTITDYFTSRLNSKLWAEGKVHYFFVAVGGDQILHYIQLFTTYYLLTKIGG